jgi:glutathione synthase/RimK-type ligase-like ATP-grasp enzyme
MNGLLIYRHMQGRPEQSKELGFLIEAFAKFKLKLIAVPSTDLNRLIETTNKGFFKFAVLLDNDPQIAKFLEADHQMKVFNDSSAINLSMDRALLSITLRNAFIPSPATIALPYSVNVNLIQVIQEVKEMMKDIQYPVLVKNRYPQMNEKIYYVRDEKELVKVLEPIGMQPLIVQAYVPPQDRQLFKILVIGKRVIAGVEVVSNNGVEYLKQMDTPQDIKKIAIKTAKATGTAFALISIFYLNKKNPYVYSVKTNPNIVELQVVTGMYLSGYLAKYIFAKTKSVK